MDIASSTSAVALISGLTGALGSAFLSYWVRVKVKERDEEKRQRKLAHVYFVQLTDFVAADFLMKEVVNKAMADTELKGPEFELSHGVAALLASRFSALDQESRIEIRNSLKPALTVVCESVDKVFLSPAQLADLSQDTVYFYHRYSSASIRFKTSSRTFLSLLDGDASNSFDAATLHSLFQSYRAFADASGVLRAAFRSSANISDEASVRYLKRSYTVLQKEIQEAFESQTKLDKAKQIVGKTADANLVIGKDVSPGGA